MHIHQDAAEVLFACNCMTHDQTSTKFWYHEEYEVLNLVTLKDKLEQHRKHCPYKETTNEIKTWTKTLQELSSS